MISNEFIIETASKSVAMLFIIYNIQEGKRDRNFDKVENGIDLPMYIDDLENWRESGRYLPKMKDGYVYDYVTGKEIPFEQISKEKMKRIELMLQFLLQEDEALTKSYT